jgi:PAS domain S-box-containing protein
LGPVHRRWVETRVFPSSDGLSVYFLDVTERKKAEARVRESEAKFRALFEHTLDGIQLTSPDGQILDSNPAACRMLQRTSDEITAIGRAGIVDTTDPRLQKVLEERARHGHARAELTFVRKDGTKFPVEVSSAIFTDAQNNLRTSLTFRDLTEAKRSETALRILAEASGALGSSLEIDTVLANLAALVVPRVADIAVIDVVEGPTTRRFVATRSEDPDPRVEVLRASTPDHATERGVSRVLRTREPELVSVVTDDWLRAAARDEAHLEAVRALAPRSVMMVPLIARDTMFGVLSLAHLDETRRFEEADLPVARGLADRAALAIDNARLYEEAVLARKRRDEMLGVVSHDLRTPLNGIALRAHVLARRHPTIDFEPILKAVGHAERLVDDLLTITAIESGKLPLHRRDESLAAILGEVIDIHRSTADDRQLALRVDCASDVGHVCVDRHRIVQALANLVGNAIKFTPSGGTIDVRARAGDGVTAIEVSDTGVGIPEDQLDKLFDRFFRGRHDREGVGLGLAIAKGVVDAHGGELSVRSEPGAGTAFTITLPNRV